LSVGSNVGSNLYDLTFLSKCRAALGQVPCINMARTLHDLRPKHREKLNSGQVLEPVWVCVLSALHFVFRIRKITSVS